MLEFYGTDVWAQLGPRFELRPRGQRQVAAIAYAGRHANSLLRLRRGDIIVVDASAHTMAAGSTHPDTLADWVARGVRVYSLEALHAKVVVLEGDDPVAIVGSHNASAHSRDDLMEAALVTNDQAVLRDARAQIDIWVAQAGLPMTSDDVEDARRQYRPPAKRPRRRQFMVAPANALWLVWWHEDQHHRPPAVRTRWDALRAQTAGMGHPYDLRIPGSERSAFAGIVVDDSVLYIHEGSGSGRASGALYVYEPHVLRDMPAGTGRSLHLLTLGGLGQARTRLSALRTTLTRHNVDLDAHTAVQLPANSAALHDVLALFT